MGTQHLRSLQAAQGPLLLGSMDAADAQREGELSILWTLTCSFFVVLMQPGFALLEAGSIRSKNVKNILLKNIVDAAISVLAWFAVGYAFAYGTCDQGPFIGALCGAAGRQHISRGVSGASAQGAGAGGSTGWWAALAPSAPGASRQAGNCRGRVQGAHMLAAAGRGAAWLQRRGCELRAGSGCHWGTQAPVMARGTLSAEGDGRHWRSQGCWHAGPAGSRAAQALAARPGASEC